MGSEDDACKHTSMLVQQRYDYTSIRFNSFTSDYPWLPAWLVALLLLLHAVNFLSKIAHE